MALVDYSDSDSEENNSPEHGISSPTKKRQASLSPKHQVETKRIRQDETKVTKLPPLPSIFHNLYPTASRTSTHDDPSLHGGRKRAVPHIDGNWATHIYVEWHPTDRETTTLSAIVSSTTNDGGAQASSSSSHQSKLHSLLCNELGAQLPLHISLSRTLVLSTDKRQSFSDRLERSITACAVRPFEVSFADLDWVANYEQTRWFLVLRLARSVEGNLGRLLNVCNEAAGAFRQPLLYADAKRSKRDENGPAAAAGRERTRRGSEVGTVLRTSELSTEEAAGHSASRFHVSIAWTLERPSVELLARTRSVNEVRAISKGLEEMCVRFDVVKLKIGNVVKDIALMKAQESKGLIGS
ncbi:MAG: poly(U)-specific 3'-to-5' RNA exonuclease [Peltula sp. TS41687]|nr:MAG: poly(U)-specific 3'-to-5' RNA exonuclease [Peltula sp. TS41687]